MGQWVDITDEMLLWNDATRHVWNVYLSGSEHRGVPEAEEARRRIEVGLFQAIVLLGSPHVHLADQLARVPLDWIRVVPSASESAGMFQEPSPPHYLKWSCAHSFAASIDDYFDFVKFTDWDQFGVIDSAYVLVKVRKLRSRPADEGNQMMTRNCHCRFFLKNGASDSAA